MSAKLYKPHAIATWFINRVERDAGDDITHLKLQKLLYYAQAWHLANYGKPLFDEEMAAWTHGPVVESIWHKYKRFTWESLPPETVTAKVEAETARFLEAVYRSYGPFTAKALEGMTHGEPPWKEARGNLPIEAKCTTPISKESMQRYYSQLIETKDAGR